MDKFRSGLQGLTMTSVLALAAFSANAADIYVPAAGGYKDGPVCCAPTWAGYYLGVNGGGGWGDSNNLIFTDTVRGTGNAGPFDRKGGFGGIQAGYNWQGGLGFGNAW